MPVLDTNLLIRAHEHEPTAASALRRLASSGEALIVPAAAAIEFLAGEEDTTASWSWLKEDFEVAHTTDLLVLDAARRYQAARMGGKPKVGWADAVVAATAALNATYVVTTNKRDFTALGVPAWNYESETEPPGR